MRLLVVEDEAALADTLEKALREERFAVDLARDGNEALFKISHVDYDAVILDVMLPAWDGWSVLRQARALGRRTPVLMLTARDTIDDRVKGLNLGADDYLVKPFALAELVARVNALIRRSYGGAPPTLKVGDIEIDSAARRVYRTGGPVNLTAREYSILELLVRARGRLVTRSMLVDHLYSEDIAVGSNVIDVHVAALRRKIGSNIIKTRRGEGYIVDV
ncbi:MAG: response regulator transcription factor [Acidobacteria bacterium]|nr:response regulator transcription factor [Acidobacteriota bacterium]